MATQAKVTFKIHYDTVVGENVAICGSGAALGNWDVKTAYLLSYKGGGAWEGSILFPTHETIQYKYLIVDPASTPIRWEHGDDRTVKVSSGSTSLELRDFWRPSLIGGDRIVRSAAFTDAIFKRTKPNNAATASSAASKDAVLVHFRLDHIVIPKSFDIFLVGSSPQLGSWQVDQAAQLSDSNFPLWTLSIPLNPKDGPVHYKYICKSKDGRKTLWERAPNRYLDFSSGAKEVVVTEFPVAFEHVPAWRGAGIAVPVFSLRSKQGLGVGEFLDIKLMVDWAVKSGMTVIQVLPVNDTCVHNTWWDTYPYSSLSVCALHPMYVNIDALDEKKEFKAEIDQCRKLLNEGFLKYEEMMSVKKNLLNKLFKSHGETTLASDKFKAWFADNETWVVEYAVFCVLRDLNKTSNFNLWPKYSNPTRGDIADLAKEHSAAIKYWYYIQFHLDQQLREASVYAAQHGIALKGDLPIGVDPFSVDVWANRKLFRTHVQVGAPPDAFSCDGQNWGFPAYDWDEMAKDDYGWWRQRLRILSKYFHAYRIDHILGFFRIWEIPKNCMGGLLGFFHPSVPVWRRELEDAGVRDFERLTKPYIRNHHLQQFSTADVNTYFQETSAGVYEFRSEYANEVAIDTKLSIASASEEQKTANEELKQRLFSLMRNVVLLQDPDFSDRFYPRINMHKTDSYLSLPDALKERLYRLYVSYYYERQDEEWRRKAMLKLPVMQQTTTMTVCGEDLGMIPACVQGVLDDLSLLGLRIQRMPKDSKVNFDQPNSYPYMTVCSPSVHDTSTLRGFWEEDRALTQQFFYESLGEWGEPPLFCEPWVIRKIIYQHLYSPSILCIFLLQDLFALTLELRIPNPEDERINIPAKNRFHYWKYRIQLNLEDLISIHGKLASDIHDMLRESNRTLHDTF